MKALVAGCWLSLWAVPALWAQSAAPVLQFSLDRVGPPVVQFTLTVDASGNGSYSPRLTPSGPVQVSGTTDGDAKSLHVGPLLVRKLFAAVPIVEGGRCETHNKGIAKTGVKVLRYAGTGRDAQCTYNYSDDDRVNDATSAFEGIAETLQYGDRLRAKLRFDRLGLDTELDQLQSAVTEQRALEVSNIAPVLQSIVENDRVMDRVRRKAETLLQGARPSQAADEAGSSLR